MSAFDDPKIRAESVAVLGASLCDHGFDATFQQCTALSLRVVATIGIENDTELWERPASLHAQNWWNRIDARQELRDIVGLRTSEDRGDGRAVCVYKDVMFRTWTGAIRGVLAGFSPALEGRTNDEATAACERSSWSAARSLSNSNPPIRHARLLPVVELLPAGCVRIEAQSGRQVVPTNTCPEHEQRMTVSASRSGTWGRPPGRSSREGRCCINQA
ncbi:MAG: hypothetical protein E5299_00944 [Burkholderia gladioli]|nr:MAG: hypothetical protein E5299_00944 [Burkholderia gladioli]